MCDDHERSAAESRWSAPRAAKGPAVDPVTVPEVDEVTITTMVDNTFDALLASADGSPGRPWGRGECRGRDRDQRTAAVPGVRGRRSGRASASAPRTCA